MNPFWILNLFWIYQHYFYSFTTLNLYSLPLQENEKSTDKTVWSQSPEKEICPKYVCDRHKSLCGFLHILYHPLCLLRPSCEMLLWQRPQTEDTKNTQEAQNAVLKLERKLEKPIYWSTILPVTRCLMRMHLEQKLYTPMYPECPHFNTQWPSAQVTGGQPGLTINLESPFILRDRAEPSKLENCLSKEQISMTGKNLNWLNNPKI